MSWRNYCVIR